jgi:hypothetical protein
MKQKLITNLMNNYYIFTEIIGCGKIGKIALDSFHKCHNLPVHIYGTKEDFIHITENKNNIFVEVDNKIIQKFNLGHWGTAFLWEKVIKSSPTEIIIHFDSDVIFRSGIIDELIIKSQEGFDLIGPRRNYHNNKNDRNDVRFITDLCQTDLILFNKKNISKKYTGNPSGKDIIIELGSLSFKKIVKNSLGKFRQILSRNYSVSKLCKMIHGTYTPFSFPNIDFFDPVMIDMINNGSKIFYLDPTETGTYDFYGKSHSLFDGLDYGTKLVHFSGVGSGLNFLEKRSGIKTVSESYKSHCINRYKLFCRLFYGEYINDSKLLDDNKDILGIKDWY